MILSLAFLLGVSSCLRAQDTDSGELYKQSPQVCVSDDDCQDKTTECVDGTCLCRPGLFTTSDGSCLPMESCVDAQTLGGKSGVYTIVVNQTSTMTVWCDMDSGDGGWLVFQRRVDGSVDFYRNWTEYEAGFGDVTGEFWLGLSKLHDLTKEQSYRLRVDLAEGNGHRHYAEYSSFSVGGPETNYRLTVSGYSGTAGDSMGFHNGQRFSTFDRDNDKSSVNCAAECHGAWWYKESHRSNLNGQYKADGASGNDGINWVTAHYDWRSFTVSEMKVQPV